MNLGSSPEVEMLCRDIRALQHHPMKVHSEIHSNGIFYHVNMYRIWALELNPIPGHCTTVKWNSCHCILQGWGIRWKSLGVMKIPLTCVESWKLWWVYLEITANLLPAACPDGAEHQAPAKAGNHQMGARGCNVMCCWEPHLEKHAPTPPLQWHHLFLTRVGTGQDLSAWP